MSSSSHKGVSARYWQLLIDSLRTSRNPYEQNAIYHGVVAADGSPILIDRSLYREHVHFLGTTGGGKSSMGLAPVIEQLISFGDSTVIILDLKGDSSELYAAAEHARDHLEERTGLRLPMKHFTLEHGKSTYPFNPLATPEWASMTHLQRADILGGACGLIYGDDYGRGYFSAANGQVILTADQMHQRFPSFRHLLRNVAELVNGKDESGLPQELRRAGVHSYEVLTRLAAIKQLNVTSGDPLHETAINLVDCFKTPQINYFKLPSTMSQRTCGTVARLVSYFLMTAANDVPNRRQVYLVIDEFQRMAAESLAPVFELARSLDISLIISNQSIEDLGRHKSGLLNVVETNCSVRQWFSVAGRHDLRNLEIAGCLREVEERTEMVRPTNDGLVTSYTTRRHLLPRISVKDALYVSNAPELSILRINGARDGYSHYRGLPFIAGSCFHITKQEFEKRRTRPWPETGPGMMTSEEALPPSLGNRRQRRSKGFPGNNRNDDDHDQNTFEFSDWPPKSP